VSKHVSFNQGSKAIAGFPKGKKPSPRAVASWAPAPWMAAFF